MDEVLFVAEASGRVLHPLDLGVDGFASRVRDAVLEVGDDVGEGNDVQATIRYPRYLEAVRRRHNPSNHLKAELHERSVWPASEP